jgi:hypothetical protein
MCRDRPVCPMGGLEAACLRRQTPRCCLPSEHGAAAREGMRETQAAGPEVGVQQLESRCLAPETHRVW